MQSIPERACVHNVNMLNVARLYCAYSYYHALRKLHTDLILDAISSENFEHVIEELLSLIILFGADTSRGIGINHHFAPETDMMAQDVMPSYRHDAAKRRLN